MALYSWNLESDINRIFDDFIKDLNVARRGSTRANRTNNTFVPLMDVHETENDFFVNAELPVCI
jgi:HSP20 family protein